MSNQHVTKRSDGKWQVLGEGNSRATAVTKTQRDGTMSRKRTPKIDKF